MRSLKNNVDGSSNRNDKGVILEKEWYDIKQDGNYKFERQTCTNLIGRYKPPEESDLLVNEPESNPGDDDFSSCSKNTKIVIFILPTLLLLMKELLQQGVLLILLL